MHDPRKRIVEVGYDQIAQGYLTWAARIEGDPSRRYLSQFADRLPSGSRVLDLGCGPGVPITHLLARRFEVIGVDISEVQLRMAARNVPEATLIQADFSQLAFNDEAFDGIVALYSISHVPRVGHRGLLSRLCRWLAPSGLLLASLGSVDNPDWTGEWLGAEMFFSSHDAATNRNLLTDAGFELLVDDVVEMKEPAGRAAFLWVLARKR